MYVCPYMARPHIVDQQTVTLGVKPIKFNWNFVPKAQEWKACRKKDICNDIQADQFFTLFQ